MLLEVRNLSFQYYGSSRLALENVSLQVSGGEIVMVAGHSGSGKSTLLQALNGLIPHQHAGDYSGSVLVDGLEVARTKMSELATRVGYVFQNPENQIFMFSVEKDVAFGLENLGLERGEIRKRVDWALDLLGITPLALRAPHELSDGQKQRAAIAGVLAMRPKILILDEPTSLLDPYTASNLVNLVRQLRDNLGITVIIVEHRLNLLSRIATRMVVVEHGRVAFDSEPRLVLTHADISSYGVTEPTVSRLAKISKYPFLRLPVDPEEMAAQIRSG